VGEHGGMESSLAVGIVFVTPVYEDREAAARLFREIAAGYGAEAFVVAVDDGSVRNPIEPGDLAQAGVAGLVIRLKRNVGHQRAIAVGLNFLAASGPRADCVVVLDSDGEDRPESAAALRERVGRGDADVVVAQRRNRVEGLRFRAFYVVYKWLFKLMTGRTIGFGNFMAMGPAGLARLASMQELWIHVAGCVLTSRLRIEQVPLDRGERYAGYSKMSFVGLVLHGFKALMVFAEDVLVRTGIACAIIAALSVLGMAIAVVLKMLGFATPGWFSVALGIMLLVFMQTGTLTLMTLMLTGVVRSGSVVNIDYRDFIDSVLPVPGPSR
jgi:hypothetical protein